MQLDRSIVRLLLRQFGVSRLMAQGFSEIEGVSSGNTDDKAH
jgi:hypothetical protein